MKNIKEKFCEGSSPKITSYIVNNTQKKFFDISQVKNVKNRSANNSLINK